MKFYASLLIAFVVGCAAGDDSTVGPEDAPPPSQPVAEGKADGVQSSDDIDLCAEFDLYGDGECHTFCAEHDADCGEPMPEADPPVDLCEAEGRYDDGTCDEDCAEDDPDCAPEPDVCLDEYRYADGNCDEDCLWVDTDCLEEVDTSVIDAQERRICESFGTSAAGYENDLAHSICMDREGQALIDCIGACVEVSR